MIQPNSKINIKITNDLIFSFLKFWFKLNVLTESSEISNKFVNENEDIGGALDVLTFLEKDLVSNVKLLKNENSEILLKLNKVDDLLVSFASEMEHSANEITIRDVFDKAVTRITLILNDVVRWAERIADNPGNVERIIRLNQFKDRYTVYDEYKIHEAFVGLKTSLLDGLAKYETVNKHKFNKSLL